METIFATNFARNYEKKIILGISDAWMTSHLSQRTSEPEYYIVDCRILHQLKGFPTKFFEIPAVLFQWRMGHSSKDNEQSLATAQKPFLEKLPKLQKSTIETASFARHSPPKLLPEWKTKIESLPKSKYRFSFLYSWVVFLIFHNQVAH